MKKLIPILLICFAFAIPKTKQIIYDAKWIEQNFVLIPAGSFTMGNCDDQDAPLPLDPNNKCRTVSVQQFFMLNQEISNNFYRQFLAETKPSLDTIAYKNLFPDTAVWRIKQGYMEPYVEYYFRHPAYNQYPLVGVNYNQCIKFCQWLTAKYNSDPKRKYAKVEFDLPTHEQWVYAAKGGLDMSPFPWGGPFMQNTKGEQMANFLFINQAVIGRMEFEQNSNGKIVKREYLVAGSSGTNVGSASNLNDNFDVTAPVKSYWPNDYGLFNMSGNVEEFVKEKGISKGGSWRDTGYYLQINTSENYVDSTETSNERGFRVVMKVIDDEK